MAANIAQRRSKKAARRKMALAEKRKIEALDNAPAARIRRAVAGPIQHCEMHEDLFVAGMGTLVVVRGAPGEMILCGFLLDVFCLGIKGVQIRDVTLDEVELFVDQLDMAAPLKAVEPAYARKLLRELAAWAESIGFPQPRDMALAERILNDADPETCDATFQFGRDGKPFYVPGPSETSSEIRRRIESLQRRLGENGFEVMIEMDESSMLAAEPIPEDVTPEAVEDRPT